MRHPRGLLVVFVVLATVVASAPAAAQNETDEGEEPTATGDSGSLRRSNRMEFDERLVKGQAASSGAVYLFKRVPRQLPGLVPLRVSYRSAIVDPVLGERELEAPRYSDRVDGADRVVDGDAGGIDDRDAGGKGEHKGEGSGRKAEEQK